MAFDADGKEIRRFSGNSGDHLHQKNFIDAVRARDASQLNAEVAVGNDSTGWCNLANIAFRAGSRYSPQVIQDGFPQMGGLAAEVGTMLAAHGLDLDGGEVLVSPILEIDPASGQFTGPSAAKANPLLTREYRDGFVLPEIG